MPFPAFRGSEYDRERVQMVPVGDSLTKQSFAEECDINVIMARIQRGIPLPVMNLEPMYADFSDGLTYQEAMNAVVAAQATFNQVPAEIRARFGNDPAQFLDFVVDPANKDELIKMGLAAAGEPVAPVVPAPVAQPAAAPAPAPAGT